MRFSPRARAATFTLGPCDAGPNKVFFSVMWVSLITAAGVCHARRDCIWPVWHCGLRPGQLTTMLCYCCRGLGLMLRSCMMQACSQCGVLAAQRAKRCEDARIYELTLQARRRAGGSRSRTRRYARSARTAAAWCSCCGAASRSRRPRWWTPRGTTCSLPRTPRACLLGRCAALPSFVDLVRRCLEG
jgi:hypothetical protein